MSLLNYYLFIITIIIINNISLDTIIKNKPNFTCIVIINSIIIKITNIN